MLKTEKEQKADLVMESLKNAIGYNEYRTLVADHAANRTSTGPSQTEALTNYTILSHARMKRLDKTVKISEEIEEKFKNFKGNQTWVVLTESWCGDAAQSMPAMNRLANLASHIDFKVVQRDENIDLMNAFLTNGSMSIPKLVVLDNEAKEVIADWGPRPSIATGMVNDYKEEHGQLTPEFKKDLQIWYNKDKSQNIIEDLAKLID
ncbi:MAG: thioredoxin family protein [Bacteroidota bacterium]